MCGKRALSYVKNYTSIGKVGIFALPHNCFLRSIVSHRKSSYINIPLVCLSFQNQLFVLDFSDLAKTCSFMVVLLFTCSVTSIISMFFLISNIFFIIFWNGSSEFPKIPCLFVQYRQYKGSFFLTSLLAHLKYWLYPQAQKDPFLLDLDFLWRLNVFVNHFYFIFKLLLGEF